MFPKGEMDMVDMEDVFDIIKTAIVCDYLNGREVGCRPYDSLQYVCGYQFDEITDAAYKNGFVRFSVPQEGLAHLTVPKIKDILRAHGLKLSGKKDDLIARVVDSVNVQEYVSDVPQVYILTDAGKDLVDANYIFIKRHYELSADFCSEVIEAAVSIGCGFSRDDYIRVFRKMYEDRCEREIRNKNWGQLETLYYQLADLLNTEDEGGSFEEAEAYELRGTCISLSGMTDCNTLDSRDMACVKWGVLNFLSSFRFTHSVKKEKIIRDFIPIAKEMFDILPFSYFYPPSMVLILNDAMARKRENDFMIDGKKKYAPLWRSPDAHSRAYSYYPLPDFSDL